MSRVFEQPRARIPFPKTYSREQRSKTLHITRVFHVSNRKNPQFARGIPKIPGQARPKGGDIDRPPEGIRTSTWAGGQQTEFLPLEHRAERWDLELLEKGRGAWPKQPATSFISFVRASRPTKPSRNKFRTKRHALRPPHSPAFPFAP